MPRTRAPTSPPRTAARGSVARDVDRVQLRERRVEPDPAAVDDVDSGPIAPEAAPTVIDPPGDTSVDFETKTREMSAVDLEALGLAAIRASTLRMERFSSPGIETSALPAKRPTLGQRRRDQRRRRRVDTAEQRRRFADDLPTGPATSACRARTASTIAASPSAHARSRRASACRRSRSPRTISKSCACRAPIARSRRARSQPPILPQHAEADHEAAAAQRRATSTPSTPPNRGVAPIAPPIAESEQDAAAAAVDIEVLSERARVRRRSPRRKATDQRADVGARDRYQRARGSRRVARARSSRRRSRNPTASSRRRRRRCARRRRRRCRSRRRPRTPSRRSCCRRAAIHRPPPPCPRKAPPAPPPKKSRPAPSPTRSSPRRSEARRRAASRGSSICSTRITCARCRS